MDNNISVLIIEDSDSVVETIALGIKLRWPEAQIKSTGRGIEGIKLLSYSNFDLVILDLGLIDTNGFDVLKRLRTFSSVPVIILTVRKDESDIIKGLEFGADDYMVKPFHQLELTSRINTILRRSTKYVCSNPIVCGNIQLDFEERCVVIGNKIIHITRNEAGILRHLIENQGKTVTHRSLAESVWGVYDPGICDSIKVYIHRLREKIEDDPSNPKRIVTNAGLGYTINSS